jgi:hypothetical protein
VSDFLLHKKSRRRVRKEITHQKQGRDNLYPEVIQASLSLTYLGPVYLPIGTDSFPHSIKQVKKKVHNSPSTKSKPNLTLGF